jgi:hypothetical protein
MISTHPSEISSSWRSPAPPTIAIRSSFCPRCANRRRQNCWCGAKTTNSRRSTMLNAMRAKSRKRGSSGSSQPAISPWKTTRRRWQKLWPDFRGPLTIQGVETANKLSSHPYAFFDSGSRSAVRCSRFAWCPVTEAPSVRKPDTPQIELQCRRFAGCDDGPDIAIGTNQYPIPR